MGVLKRDVEAEFNLYKGSAAVFFCLALLESGVASGPGLLIWDDARLEKSDALPKAELSLMLAVSD